MTRMLCFLGVVLFWALGGQTAQAQLNDAVRSQVERLNEQALALYLEGDYAGAVEQGEQVLTIAQAKLGPTHPQTVRAYTSAALYLLETGDFGRAEQVALEAVERAEARYGPDDTHTLTAVNNLGLVYSNLGNFELAERYYLRVLEGREALFGPDHELTLNSISNLSVLYANSGQYDEAEVFSLRVLETRQRVLGLAHRDTLRSLANHASLLSETGRAHEAVPLTETALEAAQQLLGPEHPLTLTISQNLSVQQSMLGRDDEAVKGALATYNERLRTLGPTHPDTVNSLISVAAHTADAGRYDEAEALNLEILEWYRASVGLDHPMALLVQTNMAFNYWDSGQPLEAQASFEAVLAGRLRTLGGEHPDTIRALRQFARLRMDALDADLPAPAPSLFEATSGTLDRLARRFSLAEPDVSTFDNPVSQATLARDIAAAYHGLLSSGDIAPDDRTFLDPMFQLAQAFVFSSAADALRASTAALTVDDPQTRALVDATNRATGEFQAAEAALASVLAQPVASQDQARLAALRERRDAALNAVEQANEALVRADVDLASLSVARTVSLDELQAEMRWAEAVLMFSDLAEGGYMTAFLVTRDTAIALPYEFTSAELIEPISQLRTGLELDLGDDYALTTADLLDQPFDLITGKLLYDLLFGPMQEHLYGIDHIKVVADGALQTIPMHVLVRYIGRGDTDFERYRRSWWLGDQYVFSVLPAVSSLIAVRQNEIPYVDGSRPMLGIGDPALGDYDTAPGPNDLASLDTVFLQFANASGATSIENLPSLRQTAALLREVQASLELEGGDILLGRDALEATLMQLSETGALAEYVTITFATHALVNGEIEGLDEPAIVLTPADGSDGLLRASEIVQLDLNARLVILAACNTAAADGSPGAEALSGLARAFIYAGARSLIVSNWPAEASATAELMALVIERREVGVPGVLKIAMERLRDDHEYEFYAHPAMWAPFVVVMGD